MRLLEFLKRYGILYSNELGINFSEEPFKWLLASILFGARISTTIAKNIFKIYAEEELTSPEKIVSSSKRILIEVHGRGGYVRYDRITADYVVDIAKKLLDDCDGNIENLDKMSENPRDLEQKLKEFKGIGPVTVKIFLRELRGIWKNADSEPTSIEVLAAKELKILKSEKDALAKLKSYWNNNRIEGYEFRHFETALVGYGLELRRKKPNFNGIIIHFYLIF